MNTSTKSVEPIPRSGFRDDFQRVRAFPRAVWVMIIGSFINKLGTFVLPYMALYLSQKGFGVREIGFVMASWGVGNLLASIVGGHLADTLGRRLTVVISMLSCAFFLVLLAYMNMLWSIIGFAFLTSLFSEIYRPAGHALVSDLVSKEDRILVYSILRWAINAGFAVGPTIAGLLSHISYKWIFWFDALTSAVYGLMALWLLPKLEQYDKPPPSHLFRAFSSLKASFRVSFTDLRFVQVFFASLLNAYGFLQTFVTLGLDVKSRGLSEVIFGLVLGLNGVMIIVCELPLTFWVRRQNQKLMMMIGYLLIGIGFGIFSIYPGKSPLFAGMAILTVGEMIALPVGLAYVSNLAPDNMRGRYMGMWGFSWAVAMVIATSTGLKLYELMGSSFWLGVGSLSALGSFLLVFNVKNPDARELQPVPVSN